MAQKGDISDFIKLARDNLKVLEELAKVVEGPLLNERSKRAIALQIAGTVEDQIDGYLDFYDILQQEFPRPSAPVSPPPEKEAVRNRNDSSSAVIPMTTPSNVPSKRR